MQGLDPYGVPLIKRVLPMTGVVVVAAWAMLAWGFYNAAEESGEDAVQLVAWLWTAAAGGACGLAVLTSPLWLGANKGLNLRGWMGVPRLGGIGVGLALAAVFAGLGYAMQATELGIAVFGLSPAAGLAHSVPSALGALVALLCVELFFRGILFDALARISGKGNAAIGVSFISAVLLIHPLMLGVSIAASVLRMRWDSVWPGYLVAVAGLVAASWGVVG